MGVRKDIAWRWALCFTARFIPKGKTMAIVISKDGRNAVRVEKSAFDKEEHLEKYIFDNPESLPLYEIKADIRLLIMARQFPTQSGPIDSLGVDMDGELYIIETKLFKNADKRTVVAQALDYGAALWKHSNNFSEFLVKLDEYTLKTFNLRAVDKIREFFQLSDESVESLVDRMKSNLDDGKFHFVVPMDKLDDRLKDLILYVNQNSQFDIYAIELEYYKHAEYEIVIPKIFGAEVKKDLDVTKSAGILWNWDLFKKRLAEFGEETVAVAQEIINWTESNGIKIDWSSSKRGSFILCFYANNKKGFFPFSVTGDAMLCWNAPHQGDYSPHPFDKKEKRAEILERIKAISTAVDTAKVDGYSAFKLPLSTLASENARNEFFSICSWIKSELEKQDQRADNCSSDARDAR